MLRFTKECFEAPYARYAHFKVRELTNVQEMYMILHDFLQQLLDNVQ